MGDWVASGRLVEVILALTLVEGIALAAYHRFTGRGVSAHDFALNLLSGLCLLAALREALVGAWWGWVTVALTLALLAHLADLGRRWQRPGRQDTGRQSPGHTQARERALGQGRVR